MPKFEPLLIHLIFDALRALPLPCTFVLSDELFIMNISFLANIFKSIVWFVVKKMDDVFGFVK